MEYLYTLSERTNNRYTHGLVYISSMGDGYRRAATILAAAAIALSSDPVMVMTMLVGS